MRIHPPIETPRPQPTPERWTRQASRHLRAGFSLLEVLCAVLILGVAVVGLTQGITTALRSSKDSEIQAQAALYAAGLIESLRADGYLVDGTDDGDCGPGLTHLKWVQTIRASDLDGLHEVDVLIQNAEGKTIYELKTLLFEIPEERTAPSGTDRQRSNPRDRGRRS